MCTSFAVYKGKPIYAMNFDCWNLESRIRIDQHDSVSTFFYETNLEGKFLETAGMNSYGFFGNFQGNLSEKHQNIIPDSKCIVIDELYRESLHSARSIKDFYSLLGEKIVAYNPVPPIHNLLHNMFADKDGAAIILETADMKNDITEISGSFMVMTNFPAGLFKNLEYSCVNGAGSDRYIKAFEQISSHQDIFDIPDAFAVLKSTVQKEENWETLISMVFVPDELAVYFSLNRNFDKIWRADINKKHVQTYYGFNDSITIEMGENGISMNGLREWGG
ncbi:MAG TPA: hypothetical protein VHT34_10775 [Clostridia bacterium]|nr:hypothetical protein [Clostridia bacterium]